MHKGGYLLGELAPDTTTLTAERNRITSGIEEGIEVRMTVSRGRGVFAKRVFYPQEMICTYQGDLLSVAEAKKREEKYKKSGVCLHVFFPLQ